MLKKIAAIMLAIFTTVSMSSCTVDVDRMQKDINELRDAVATLSDSVPSETTTITETEPQEIESVEVIETEEVPSKEDIAPEEIIETIIDEPEEIEITDEIEENLPEDSEVEEITEELPEEVEAEPTPVVTVERVDFSEFGDLELTTDVVVENEAFREVFSTEDESLEFAEFSGNRSMVTIDVAPNVATAINLMVDGFYQEALGNYSRVVASKQAELALDPEAELPVTSVSVLNEMTTNGRIITVKMDLTIEEDDETISFVEEVYSFDLLTGQMITLDMMTEDVDALKEVFMSEFEEEIVEIIPVFVTPTTDYIPLRIIGITEDGERIVKMIDMSNLGDYMNRFGRLISLI